MKLNYKEIGTGKPCIILHGLFGMLDNWKTVGRKLSAHHHIYLVDQRNHGKSPHTEAFDYNLLAHDLLQFIETHNLDKPTIIGHSMGGKTVMEFCRQFPEYMDKAIIVDIAPKAYKGGHEYIFEAILDVNVEAATSRKEVEQQLAPVITQPSVLAFLMKNLSRNPDGGYKWKANFKALYNNYDKILSNLPFAESGIDTEVLFIKGALSNYIQPEDEEIIHSIFTNATIEKVGNAGHWVHAQNPAKLLELIEAFVD